jgi:hypothetical protein
MKRLHQNCTPEEYDARKIASIHANLKVMESGCHEWQGFVNLTTGYAQTSYRGKSMHAHRLIYILVHGPAPRKMDVCHSCDNRKCCNLDHLWFGTRKQNLMDASAKGRVHCQQKTHCPKGHAYADHGVRQGVNQWRQCRICCRARQRVRAGWSEDLAYSMDAVGHGHRPVMAKWKRKAA